MELLRSEPNSDTRAGINYSLKGSESFDYKASITKKSEGGNLEKKMLKLLCH